ncbi:hypothetical protein NMY22_g8610 [Coprinellus aureogranulatus]|nr:hypothetical protein NMY22_g8610 [Coprinellus aureogranulatus]
MIFKLLPIVLAAASIAHISAASVQRRAEATCTFVATPDGTPSGDIAAEWSELTTMELSDGSESMTNGTTVDGPDTNGAYTITQTIRADSLGTSDEVSELFTSFVGTTADGYLTNVTWHMDSVSC